jgi:hypothetical protein
MLERRSVGDLAGGGHRPRTPDQIVGGMPNGCIARVGIRAYARSGIIDPIPLRRSVVDA